MELADASRPLLVFVGGFLGAGKTTLILQAAQILRGRGQRVAIILNDQDAGLVDTLHSEALQLPSAEVTRGCFCCRFSDLMAATRELTAYRPQVILAEPVGSCVDLSATILRPLLALESESFRLAPLTIVLDPSQADRLVERQLSPDIEYLMRHQITEADILCLSKRDLHSSPHRLPFPVDFHLSALSGEGVEDWLNEVMEGTRVVGAHLLDVDYGRYAEAEAALGWLNMHAHLTLHEPLAPSLVVGPLLDDMDDRLSAGNIVIAHLKIFDRTESGWVKASVSRNGDEPVPTGELLSEPTHHHQVVINLRALGDPEQLRGIALDALGVFPADLRILHLNAFRPAAPVPEHRFTDASTSSEMQLSSSRHPG
jgi:hypothetical protein